MKRIVWFVILFLLTGCATESYCKTQLEAALLKAIRSLAKSLSE